MVRIIITTQQIQPRRHKKRRIDKKWKKRYGIVMEVQEVGRPVYVPENNTVYMTQRDYDRLFGKTRRKRKHEKYCRHYSG